jgi:putative transposase
MPNHAHALLRTGALPISNLAHRWLGSYATAFNRVHRRAGHLFQGRFKNTLVEEEPYLLELLRYIHLNPVRSRLPVTIDSLDSYAWTGHAVLLGKREFPAQDTDFVLGHFGHKVSSARIAYRQFVRNGSRNGSVADLEGGGLRRSSRGWELLAKVRRGRERWEFDERILGSGEFVATVLSRFDDDPPHPPGDAADLIDHLCERVARHLGVTQNEIRSSSLRIEVLDARAIVSHIAVCHYGLSQTAVGRALNVSRQSIARGVRRAEAVFALHKCAPDDFITD